MCVYTSMCLCVFVYVCMCLCVFLYVCMCACAFCVCAGVQGYTLDAWYHMQVVICAMSGAQ
eukprot:m.978380 g.978380  ORF g.978380 m.978380 type:complete len:61 (+) comp23956_c1_seq19:95-277(+)